jgi:hypothetical protein
MVSKIRILLLSPSYFAVDFCKFSNRYCILSSDFFMIIDDRFDSMKKFFLKN